jgi:hypothetical protein
VKGHPANEAAAALNGAADQGCRFLFEVPFEDRLAVMRLDATPPDTYRYMPVPESGGPASLINALNQQGALGYRWLDGTDVLEKEPHPRNYEYRHSEGFTQGTRDRLAESLVEQGFHVLRGVAAGPIFIREFGNARPATRPKPVRVVEASHTGNLMKDIVALAGQGYRYRAPVSSRAGDRQAVSMEECDSTCGGPFEYRSFDAHDSAQLERDLNVLGRDGFRVVPISLEWRLHLAERPTNHARRFVYRVFEASSESSTEQRLNEGDRDGFVPLGATVHIGWTGHVYFVLEKAVARETS